MHLHAAARPCWDRRSGGTVTSFREHRRRDVLVAALLPVDALLRGATAPTRRFLGRRRTLTHQRTEDPTWEFNPESGALGVARCPSGALSGALIRASSGTVWSRDLQASRGQ